ncbi:MAG: mercuric reductase [Planctomycetales bacterium]
MSEPSQEIDQRREPRFIERHAAKMQWLAIGLIVSSLVILLRAVPAEEIGAWLRSRIDAISIWAAARRDSPSPGPEDRPMPQLTADQTAVSDEVTFPETRPLDEHNRRLVEHVHPPAWENPRPNGRYNLVVIGGGTAGLVTAAGAAGLGAKVALVERKLLGGDCLNVGCVPSKALIRSARAVADVRDAGEFGVRVPPGTTVDFPAVMERMRRIRSGISPHDSAARFRDLGVDVFLGDAKFTGGDTVEVGGQTLRFARACVATGARAAAPPIPGLKETGYLTNETVFSLTELPRRLAVIGAGPIGCELAQAFARFGSEVFLIEAMHGIMPNEDPDAAEIVKQSLFRDGVRLMCCGKNLQVARTEGGKRLTVDSHGEHYDLTVDEILVGAGRAPNVDGLGLEAAGVRFDKTGVKVDDFLRTANRRIYAAGDVCSKYKFTHAADAMARIVIQNALFFGRKRAGALVIPWCTYTDPEVAHVGLYPHEAEAQGIPLDTFAVELSQVDRAILDGEQNGFLKIHVRKGKDTILGATLVARHAGEMISEITLAMVAGAGLGAISSTIHPYPTQAEAIKKAGDAYGRTRLTPRIKHLFETLLRWRR